MDIKELVAVLCDNKLKSVAVYDVSAGEAGAEKKFIVLATAANVQIGKKAADAIAEKYSYAGKIEGYFKGEWIVFDFENDNITLHIFLPKVREKYNLDKLHKPRKVVLK